MKAAVYHRYGLPEVVQIEEVAAPTPGANDVLIRVHASTVCAPDWRFRAAKPFFVRMLCGLFAPKRKILGMEFSGRIEAVGKNVTRFKPGDDVFGSSGFSLGAHAEYLRLPQDYPLLAGKPAGMTYEEAAGVLFGGISALYFVRKAGVKAGDNVLIYGASGSVGVFAVQLAKIMGAHVTAVCSGANAELVCSLGAETVIDYTRENYAKHKRTYDVLIDCVGKSGFGRAMRALKPDGRYAQVALADPVSTLRWMLSSLGGSKRLIGGMARAEPGDIDYLRTLIEAGQLRSVVDRVYPLDQIAEAHRLAEGGHKKGAVVVRIAP